jgi:hypothetical protein
MLKKRLRFLPKKFTANPRLSLDWPGEDERSKMHLEACKIKHFTVTKLVT